MKGKDCYLFYSGGIARGGCVATGMKLGVALTVSGQGQA